MSSRRLQDQQMFTGIPAWVKRADKRSQNFQASVVKAAAVMIKLCDNLIKAEKQNYVVNTKGLLSVAMES